MDKVIYADSGAIVMHRFKINITREDLMALERNAAGKGRNYSISHQTTNFKNWITNRK